MQAALGHTHTLRRVMQQRIINVERGGFKGWKLWKRRMHLTSSSSVGPPPRLFIAAVDGSLLLGPRFPVFEFSSAAAEWPAVGDAVTPSGEAANAARGLLVWSHPLRRRAS